jgi:molybdenum cofactor synthesis domain-containing protein
MPRTGLFARVLEGGELAPGMTAKVVHRVDRSVIQAAIVTVSDRCSAGETLDTAGPAVADLLRTELQARIAWTKLVPDEVESIAEAIRDLSDRRVDLVITAGGTGISARDVTPEATRSVVERELPGLAEAMRAASAKQTPNAWLSRAVAGLRRETLVVNLPGSRKAAVENLSAILPALSHAVRMLRHQTVHTEADAGRFVTLRPATDSRRNSASPMEAL